MKTHKVIDKHYTEDASTKLKNIAPDRILKK